MKDNIIEAMEKAWAEKSNKCAELTENSYNVDKIIFSLGFLAALEYANKELSKCQTSHQ